MFFCMFQLKFHFLVFWRPFSLFSLLISKFYVNSVVERNISTCRTIIEYLDLMFHVFFRVVNKDHLYSSDLF